MPGFGYGYGIRRRRAMSAGGAAPVIRIVPASATAAYMVAPHAALGAVALHLIKGNAGDESTPSASVGAPFGDWRIQGLRILPGVESNPATQATEIIYQGVGSQEIAINFGGLYAGQYHGFGAGAAYSQTAPDMTSDHMVVSAEIESAGEMLWSAASADWSQSIELHADGRITTVTRVDMAYDAFDAYLDMTIVGTGFTRASLDGGETWQELDALALNASLTANVATIILRNPTTGTTVTVTDDAMDAPGFASRRIMRRTGDYKVYPNINPQPTGTPLGSVTVARTIVLGATEADPPPPPSPYLWNGEINGNSGFTNAAGFNFNQLSWDAGAKELVLTRAAGGYTSGFCRVIFPLAGLTIGETYSVTLTATIVGTSGSAGVTMGVSTNGSNGGGQTSPATMSAAYASGSMPYAFVATAESMYFVLNQAGAQGNDNVLRLSRIGQVTPSGALPTVTLTSASVSQAEGNSGATSYVFTVTRSASAGAASVPWSFSAGTTSADDFVGGSYPAGGTVDMANGVASGTITIQVQGDTTPESNETFTVSITAPGGYAAGAIMSATGTIINDDAEASHLWDGGAHGNAGYIAPSGWHQEMRSWDAGAQQLVFSRNASGAPSFHRTLVALPAGLTAGNSYSIAIVSTMTGTGVLSAGVILGVSVDGVNGGSQSSSATMSSALANGTYTFTALSGQNYLVINQGVSTGSDQTWRLSRLGQVTPA